MELLQRGELRTTRVLALGVGDGVVEEMELCVPKEEILGCQPRRADDGDEIVSNEEIPGTMKSSPIFGPAHTSTR